jgi:hypothetical protein
VRRSAAGKHAALRGSQLGGLRRIKSRASGLHFFSVGCWNGNVVNIERA